MKQTKVGAWLLGGLLLCLSTGLSTSARAEISMKITVEEMSMKTKMKQKPTKEEMKNIRALARNVEKKVIDERTESFAFGEPKQILLPNGNKVSITVASYDEANRILKVHVRSGAGQAGMESDLSLPAGAPFPVQGGIYKGKVILVWCTPHLK